MKQVKSERLIQRSGRDRVYEVEIVETSREGPARYLVEYRYGWAGGELKEGTRTESAVDLETAERLYASVIQSRRNQGYTDDTAPAPWAMPAAGPAAARAESPRDARLLYLLRQGSGMEDSAAAKLIWRIGQVRLAAAAPELATLRHHAGAMTARVLPYALLRCGRGDSAGVMPALQALADHEDDGVAQAARLALSDLGESAREGAGLVSRLPGIVARALEADIDTGTAQILGYLSIAADAGQTPAQTLADNGAAQRLALIDLYMLSRHAPEVRPLFLAVLDRVPFAPFLFRAIRRIHKAAEAMDDAATLGALGNRFSLTRQNYRGGDGYEYAPGRGKGVDVAEERVREDSRLAWSRATRGYFRRRMRRNLSRLGAEADPAYVPIATELLLRIDDATPREQTPDHPPHPYRFAENWLLHGAGDRIAGDNGNPVWQWNGFLNKNKIPAGREEPYPALWDAAPMALLRLLRGGRAEIVRGFALRALADNPEFARTIPLPEIVALLLSPHDAPFRFGLSLARARLTEGGTAADAPLLPALLRTGRAEAVELARMTMNLKPALATEDGSIAAAILLTAGEHTAWFDAYWRDHAASVRDPHLIGHIHGLLQDEPWDAEALDDDKARMRRVADLLTDHFGDIVRAAPKDDILALSRLPAVPPKLLAVLLAAARPDGIETFDPRALAAEDDPDLQAAGAELLAGADLAALAGNEDLILAFLAAPAERSRGAALTAARRLAEHDPQGAASTLATGILDILYRAEDHDGVREDAVRAAAIPPIRDALLREGPGRVWSLLRARAEPARRVGAGLLETLEPGAFSLRKIARIGLNDQVKARRWAVNALEARLPEIQAKPEEIFALLDGEWRDSREATYALIRENLDPAQWAPETVVALCDCVTVPAQQFGRETLARAFDDGKAALFLRRLSEHPASGFRLTVARLIRDYAGGNPDRLRELEPALRTILSRVFSSRAAKTQATAFIAEEIARGDPRSLEILGGLLGRVSATCAIGDRARILELIVRIKDADPALVPEATVIEPEIRQAGGRH